MVIVGCLLILAVIVDAWRRMRLQQRDRVRMKLATVAPGEDLLDDLSQYRELPNGGGRVVNRDDDYDPGQKDPDSVVHVDALEAFAESAPKSAPKEPRRRARDTAGERAGASDAGDVDYTAPAHREAEAVLPPDLPPDLPPEKAEQELESPSPITGMRATDDEPVTLDWLDDLPQPAAEAEEEPGELRREADTQVLILHVMARDERGFAGRDILDILLACDLRFGDMSFFHRHEERAGRGPIQFSVANMLQPGVFDIDNMPSMRTRGLVFFVTLPGPRDMAQAYDYMLETARAVARNLGGELLDESRSVLTQQAVEHSRQQIRELDQRLRVRA